MAHQIFYSYPNSHPYLRNHSLVKPRNWVLDVGAHVKVFFFFVSTFCLEFMVTAGTTFWEESTTEDNTKYVHCRLNNQDNWEISRGKSWSPREILKLEGNLEVWGKSRGRRGCSTRYIPYQEIHPYRAMSIVSGRINTYLVMMREWWIHVTISEKYSFLLRIYGYGGNNFSEEESAREDNSDIKLMVGPGRIETVWSQCLGHKKKTKYSPVFWWRQMKPLKSKLLLVYSLGWCWLLSKHNGPSNAAQFKLRSPQWGAEELRKAVGIFSPPLACQ